MNERVCEGERDKKIMSMRLKKMINCSAQRVHQREREKERGRTTNNEWQFYHVPIVVDQID